MRGDKEGRREAGYISLSAASNPEKVRQKERHGRKKVRRKGGKLAVNRRPLFDRNENGLVLAFCSFLMKADLGEAGQNLLIPRQQQLRQHWQNQRGPRIITHSSR
jgi:hypothetical protein